MLQSLQIDKWQYTSALYSFILSCHVDFIIIIIIIIIIINSCYYSGQTIAAYAFDIRRPAYRETQNIDKTADFPLSVDFIVYVTNADKDVCM